MDTAPPKNEVTQCNVCKHKIKFSATCRAFPQRIPDAILGSEHDHTKPYPGDRGIRFEPRDAGTGGKETFAKETARLMVKISDYEDTLKSEM